MRDRTAVVTAFGGVLENDRAWQHSALGLTGHQ